MGSLNILLDACVFIWLCAEPVRLSPTARELLENPEKAFLVSDVSALEITLKWTAGKLALPTPPRLWIEEQIRAWSISQLPLERSDMYRASELPSHHADPFDRLLIATAMNHGAVMLTPDSVIHAYPVAWQW